jgi:hypothetical protein
MPSTAVAARKRSWARIKHRYPVHSAAFYAQKQASALAKMKQMALNKAKSKH